MGEVHEIPSNCSSAGSAQEVALPLLKVNLIKFDQWCYVRGILLLTFDIPLLNAGVAIGRGYFGI